MTEYITDPFKLDPIDPPENASDAELLLCAGLCPHCEVGAAFRMADASNEDLICQNCGFEFTGTTPDVGHLANRPRAVAAVYAMGRQRGSTRAALPAISPRPARGA